MSDTQNLVAVSKPSIWNRLGFKYSWDENLFDWRNAEPVESDWFVPGTLNTETIIHVSFLDRLRLLVSGKCAIDCYTRTNVTVGRAESRSKFAVLPPSTSVRPPAGKG